MANEAEIRTNIDWIWGAAGDAPPAQLRVWTVRVPAGAGIYSIRGPIGARTCGNIAVLFALADERQYALEWLQAAQAHNDHVMQLFASNPDYTIDYAVSQHRTEALQYGGLQAWLSGSPIPLSYIKSALAWLGNHRPASQPPRQEEPPRPRTGEERGGSGDRRVRD